MLFTTTTQWVALAVALVAGWLFGLASHPGGRTWKRRYADEREAHAVLRRDHDTRLAEANARIKALEAENASLARATPVATAPLAARPLAATTARPAYPAETGRGWFDWRNRTRPIV